MAFYYQDDERPAKEKKASSTIFGTKFNLAYELK